MEKRETVDPAMTAALERIMVQLLGERVERGLGSATGER